jgi:hypothetical protein
MVEDTDGILIEVLMWDMQWLFNSAPCYKVKSYQSNKLSWGSA